MESDDSDVFVTEVLGMECLVFIFRALAEGRMLDVVRMSQKVGTRTRGDAHGVRLLLSLTLWELSGRLFLVAFIGFGVCGGGSRCGRSRDILSGGRQAVCRWGRHMRP